MKKILKKLNIVKTLYNSSLTYSRNIANKKLFLKVVRSYFMQCILMGNDEFYLIFKGRYIHNLSQRLIHWINFFKDTVYRFILMHFVSEKARNKIAKSFHDYELVNFGVCIPYHPKVTNAPDEFILESFLKKNGFKINDEFLYPVKTIYKIKKI